MSFDYKSFGQHDDEDDKVTQIVYRDLHWKATFAHICESKGATDNWMVEKILEDIKAMGHVDVTIKSGGEPALVQVMKEVKKRRKASTIIQPPPAYDPQANRMAEKAVQDYVGHPLHKDCP